MGATSDPVRPSQLDDAQRAQSVEDIGLLWEELGMMRMDGRVLGYLMLSNDPQVSTAELRQALKASAGSISTSTRRLKDFGFIQLVAVPGERSRFFRAGDDVWGTFLAAENKAYVQARLLAEQILDRLGEVDAQPRVRFENMRDYHEWLEQHHQMLLERWEAYKRDHEPGTRSRRSSSASRPASRGRGR